jgi:hypothetical protein
MFPEQVALLLEHDAAGDAGERLPDRRHVPDHQQAAVLAGFLFKLESLIQPAKIHARQSSNFPGIR